MKFNLIVAVCENWGIGFKGDLPWRLKSELKYFSNTTKRVRDPTKQNAVIMGKRTYFGIPNSKRPLAGRLNIVLSTTLKPSDLPEEVMLFPNLEAAVKKLQEEELSSKIENIWIVGGSRVYEEAMLSDRCHRLYLTKIKALFDCDTFFPKIPSSFKEVDLDPEISSEVQEEDGIQYEYKILEKHVN